MSNEIINGSLNFVCGAYYWSIAVWSAWRCFFVKAFSRFVEIENIGREMINTDWNGYDNASTHSAVVVWWQVMSTNSIWEGLRTRILFKHHFQINPPVFSLQLCKRFDTTNIQSKPDKHESLFALISTVYLIKTRTNSKLGSIAITTANWDPMNFFFRCLENAGLSDKFN